MKRTTFVQRSSRATRRAMPFREPLFEPLEIRQLLSITLNPLPAAFLGASNIRVPVGKTLAIPITFENTDPGPLNITAAISNPQNFSIQVLDAADTHETFLQLNIAYTDVNNVAQTGTMVFELFNSIVPKTVARITTLVNQGFYNGLTISRVLPNFVFQGGAPTGNPNGGSGTEFDDEFNANLLFSGDGQLAMANHGQNTDDSSFFVTTLPHRELDFDYTIYGQMVRGFDVRDALMQTPVTANSNGEVSQPVNTVTITSASIIQDTHDAVFLLKSTSKLPTGTLSASTTIFAVAADAPTSATDVEALGTTLSNPSGQLFQTNVTGETITEGSQAVPYDFHDSPILNRKPVTFNTQVGSTLKIAFTATQTNLIPDTVDFATGGSNFATVSFAPNGILTVTPKPGYQGGTLKILVGVASEHDLTTAVDVTTVNGHTVPIHARGVRESNYNTSDGSENALPLFDVQIITVNVAGPVTGNIEKATDAVVSGWAYDPSAGTTPIKYQVDIDGAPGKIYTADRARADLGLVLDSSNHAFTYTVPYLPAGSHTIQIFAYDHNNAHPTLLGTRTITSGSIYFSEAYYLATYKDVAAAVASGAIASGWQQFVQFGQFENRNPSPYFDAKYYLQANPSVATAVANHTVASAFQHFVLYGAREGRKASIFFDAQYYLGANTAVAHAITTGAVSSALQHFLQYGLYEGRVGILYFNNTTYQTSNPDIVTLNHTGSILSPFDQFANAGWLQNRVFSPLFNEIDYDNRYPDVAALIADHTFKNGFEHWMKVGRFENPPRDPS